jgi:protein-S-isoprenylcysteine O-methyltransferase Ste14
MSTLNNHPSNKPKLERSGINRLIQAPVFVLLLGVFLFGTAGTLDWWGAWAFLALFMLMIVVAAVWSLRHNPDLLNERGKIAENTKAWDKVILSLYTLLMLAMMVTAGLDVRFGWSAMPPGLQILGGMGLLAAMGLVSWVATTNAYLSAVVRIQEDRGHQVVDAGPYQYVRHPMYAGDLFFFWGIPLLLGSWWALVPAMLNVIVFIVRTALEDHTLQTELPGYREYAQRVRYRLLPGIW